MCDKKQFSLIKKRSVCKSDQEEEEEEEKYKKSNFYNSSNQINLRKILIF
jgi:hypothetical protein